MRMVSIRPAEGVTCRWCRSELRVSRLTRLLLDFTLVCGGAISVSWLGALYLDRGDPLYLLLMAACLLVLGVVVLVVEGVCELETSVPRDHRDWKATDHHEDDDAEWNAG